MLSGPVLKSLFSNNVIITTYQPCVYLQAAFWACALSIVVVGLAIMLVVMGFARHKRLLFIPKAHLVH